MNSNPNAKVIVPIVIGVVLLLIVFSCFHVVEPGHRGVRVTMGKVSQDVVGEGVTFKLPLGFTRIEDINVQQTKSEGDAECFSADTQTIKVKYAVVYRVAEAKAAMLYQNYRGDPYEAIIAPRVQEALKQTTARYQVEALVAKRDEVRNQTLDQLHKRMTEAGGVIEILDLSLTNIDLSDQVERAIEQKMVVEQEARTKEYESQREKLEAEITMIKARAEAESVKVRGEALAAYPMILQMEIIKKWNGVSPGVVVLGQAGSSGAQIMLPMVPAAK